MNLQFENLCFKAKSGKVQKNILNDISGIFKSGELTAIMGPSGAGKSSLLNILSGFQKNGISGNINCISLNGKCFENYHKNSCYILQGDRLNPLFTVKEIMYMVTNFKLGHSINQKEKEKLIEDILERLGITNVVNTRCSRLSGGERRRLSVALELISDPEIMFFDEPTTGLDSLSSLQCIKLLKELANKGRIIVCTIHQPSARIFEIFDSVYVLAEGKCIYQGLSKETVNFLSSMGLECPQYHNPADYLLEVANKEHGDVNNFLAEVMRTRCLNEEDKQLSGIEIAEKCDLRSPSEWYKFCILIQRCYKQFHRDWTLTYLKLIIHILVGIFVGLIFPNSGNNALTTMTNIKYLMICIIYLNYTSMFPAVLKFPGEIPILKKECFNNWYKLHSYYFAFLISNAPLQIIFTISFIICSYTITGQPFEFGRFLMFLFMTILITLTAEISGLIVGTVLDPVNGTFFAAVANAFFIAFSGAAILFPHMSKLMYALSYGSYMSYGLEGLVQTMYGYNRTKLYCPEKIIFCIYDDPSMILKEMGMVKQNYNYDILFYIVIIILSVIIGYYTLRRKVNLENNN